MSKMRDVLKISVIKQGKNDKKTEDMINDELKKLDKPNKKARG